MNKQLPILIENGAFPDAERLMILYNYLNDKGWISDTAPTNPFKGQFWFDTSGVGELKVYDGAEWKSLGFVEVMSHADLSDMPDEEGANSDHDARYHRKGVDLDMAGYDLIMNDGDIWFDTEKTVGFHRSWSFIETGFLRISFQLEILGGTWMHEGLSMLGSSIYMEGGSIYEINEISPIAEAISMKGNVNMSENKLVNVSHLMVDTISPTGAAIFLAGDIDMGTFNILNVNELDANDINIGEGGIGYDPDSKTLFIGNSGETLTFFAGLIKYFGELFINGDIFVGEGRGINVDKIAPVTGSVINMAGELQMGNFDIWNIGKLQINNDAWIWLNNAEDKGLKWHSGDSVIEIDGNTRFENKLTMKNDDIETETASKGLIVKTPDGTKRYRIRVDNAGVLTTEQVV